MTLSDTDRERTMMTNPILWPVWPWLPVKKLDPEGRTLPTCGVVYADNTDGPFIINKWNGPSASSEVLATYANVDEALDAGWVVD